MTAPATLQQHKQWIDAQDYGGLLRRWRFAPAGDLIFQGEAGEYYANAMREKRALTPDNGVSASKQVGWDNPSHGGPGRA